MIGEKGNLPSFAQQPVQSFLIICSSTFHRRVKSSRCTFIEDELVENSEGFGSSFMRAAISPSVRAKSRLETYFRRNSSFLKGTDFLWVHFILVARDALLGDVCCEFLRLCERSTPLIIVEYVDSGFFISLQERELRIEEGSGIVPEYLLWPTEL